MKRVLSIFILILGLVGCANEKEANELPSVQEPEVIEQEPIQEQDPTTTPQFEVISFVVLLPSGSTAMSVAHFAATKPELADHVTYSINPYVQGSDPLVAAFTSETSQVIVAPTNLGATLYQKEVPYQLVATLVWGNLYLISNEELTFDDLSGRKITAFGQGSTPDIVLQTILKEKGLLDSVEIEYLASVSDVQSMFAAGEIDVAVIAEPSLSVLKTKVDEVNVVVDFQEQWGELYGVTSYPQASLFVHQDLIENHSEVIEPLLAQIETSVDFANQSPTEMAKEAIETGLEIPEPIIAASTPNSNLIFKTAEEAKDEIQLYLEKLYEFDPKTVGGALPDDNFYYLEK
ncbi:MAG: ABC transporter substrate-binding protein [Turicibacter sp.]|nr:ABC transporter substrate-binding protein [Turicibacter sp.]